MGVIGYKGMTKDMKCHGMQYAVGRTYRVEGEAWLCNHGLHFCVNLKDVYDYYPNENGNRYFEVEAAEPIRTDGKKSVTNQLTIIRELNGKTANGVYYSGMWSNAHIYNHGDGYDFGFSKDYCYGMDIDYIYQDGNGYGEGKGYSAEYSEEHDGHGTGNGHGYGYGDVYGNGVGKGVDGILLENVLIILEEEE